MNIKEVEKILNDFILNEEKILIQCIPDVERPKIYIKIFKKDINEYMHFELVEKIKKHNLHLDKNISFILMENNFGDTQKISSETINNYLNYTKENCFNDIVFDKSVVSASNFDFQYFCKFNKNFFTEDEIKQFTLSLSIKYKYIQEYRIINNEILAIEYNSKVREESEIEYK